MKEKIFFKNSKGDKLCGILSNPTSNIENPIILFCHGFTTSKDGRTYVRLEEILNRHELSTFRFDFFGHGESEGKFEEITTSEAVADVLNAIEFLKESGYKKIGLVGSSFGGMVSIIASPQIDCLYVLALKSPVSDYMDKVVTEEDKQEIEAWEKNGFTYVTGSEGQNLRLNYSFFEDAEKVKGYDFAQKIKIPTLIVHGNKDETVPVEQSIKAAGLMENCRLEIIDGADHTYSQPEHFEKMLNLISEFITNHKG